MGEIGRVSVAPCGAEISDESPNTINDVSDETIELFSLDGEHWDSGLEHLQAWHRSESRWAAAS